MNSDRKIHRKSPISGKAPDSMVIFLHGYGADGSDLFDLSIPYSNEMPNTQFISPDAPYDCAMSATGKEWFPIENIPFGAANAAKIFLSLLEQESKSFSIPFEKIILIGFSQGAMLALQTLLISPKRIGSVIAYSGGLSLENVDLSKDFILDNRHKYFNTPVLLIHGEMDEVVPFASLKITADLLSKIGFNIEKVPRPDLGHGIDQVGISSGIDFLRKNNF